MAQQALYQIVLRPSLPQFGNDGVPEGVKSFFAVWKTEPTLETAEPFRRVVAVFTSAFSEFWKKPRLPCLAKLFRIPNQTQPG